MSQSQETEYLHACVKEKALLRDTMKAARNAMGKPQRAEAAEAVIEKVLKELAVFAPVAVSAAAEGADVGADATTDGPIIGLTVSFGSELPMLPLAHALRDAGYQIAYPLCFAERTMEFVVEHGEDIYRLLTSKPARVFEADDPEVLALDLLEPTALDALIVPLLAFDSEGYRLGMGGGYYDTYIPRLAPGVPAIGVAYAAQHVDAVPHEPHDLPLTCILTA